MRNDMRILAATLLVAFAPLAAAQTSTGGTTTGASATEQNKGQAQVAGKIASNFVGLAGSQENSLALVNALRTGAAVNLVTEVAPPAGSPPGTLPTTTTTTFTPPTKPMGWGNVKHALALAQDQLARAGITNPTSAQLQTALMGGDLVATNADGTTKTTTVKGILTMRADGMGWGNIAKAGGTKLGPVTSKVDMSNKPVATTTTGVTTAASDAGTTPKSAKGITTAAGAASTTSASGRGLTTGAGASASPGNAYGKGIVNAGGGSVGASVSANAVNHGQGQGAGVVTGGGNSAAGITSASNAGGNGKGNSGGNGNGNGNGKAKGG